MQKKNRHSGCGGSDTHKALIANAVKRGFKEGGLLKDLVSVLEDDCPNGYAIKHIRQIRSSRTIRPDAYKIDKDARIVWLYEAVVTSPPNAKCMDNYAHLAWILDEDYWTLALEIETVSGTCIYDLTIADARSAIDPAVDPLGSNILWHTVDRLEAEYRQSINNL